MSTALPRVTLVVPVRNEEAHIVSCITSIMAQDYPPDLLEILVVDGASTDRTAELVRALALNDARIRLLDNPDRAMPTGLNLGIQTASGDCIGSVIGHSILPPDYVRRSVTALDETGAWSVGGRIVRRTAGAMHRAIGLATASRVGVGDSTHNYATVAGWVETVFPGFWRREAFDRVGSFDPRMLSNEDNELSYRIRRAGGGIWYDPAIEVEYVPRGSLPALFEQYRRYGLGKMRVLRKHRAGLRWRHLVPAAWLAVLLLGAVASVFVPVVGFAWLGFVSLYLIVIVGAATRLAEPGVAWWRIAAALLTLHLAYGVGTWQGVITWRG